MRRLPSLPLAVLLVWWSTGGCATVRPALSGIPPQRIGIVLNISTIPEFDVPAKGGPDGAKRGARAVIPPPYIHPVVVVFLLPFMAAGAIVGALKAEDAARVEEAEATLRAALTTVKPVEVVGDRLIEVAGKGTSHSLVALPGPLDTTGIDTVLELTVSTFHLRGDGPINPPFRLILGLRTRLIRVADGAVIREMTLEAESEKRKFVEWAENEARPLREGLDGVALKLAHDIVAGVLAPEPECTYRREDAKPGEQVKIREACKDKPPQLVSRGAETTTALDAPPRPQPRPGPMSKAVSEILPGTWEGKIVGELVPGQGGPRPGPRPDRTLVITSVSREDGVGGAFYGFKGDRLGWVHITVSVSADDQVALQFVSGVGSRVELRLVSDDQLVGSFTAPSTSPSSCRLTSCQIKFQKMNDR